MKNTLYNTGRNVLLSIIFTINVCLVQAQDNNYFYVGAGYQINTVKNAYYDGGSKSFLNDVSKGLIPKIAYEDFGDNGWMRLDFSLLLNAAISPIVKRPGVKFTDFQNHASWAKAAKINAYMFNDKFIHAQGAWSPGKQNILGPVVSLGLEGVAIVAADEKNKAKNLTGSFKAVNNGGIGVLSYGTGINFFNPLRALSFTENSRLTITYDWFVIREYDEKFRNSGRGRLGVELSVFLKRFIALNAYYHRINFRRAYYYDETTPNVKYGHALIHSFGAGVNLYIFRF